MYVMKQLFLIASTLWCSSWIINVNAHGIQPQLITVTNKIKPSDLKHYGQTPRFSVQVAGKTIEPGSSVSVPVFNDKLVVRYEYSFLKGVYKGANEITFKLDKPDKREYDLTFSWKKQHEPWRALLSGATAIDKKKVS